MELGDGDPSVVACFGEVKVSIVVGLIRLGLFSGEE